ncbi:hypothetical protein H920_05661 [Fukomys damarensis]|uniref:Coiled-coil domain-containing protein 201 n=1 Tax=Fukomys damarensis TaxID=885580 RepID=A0A091DRZ4_FUKDA|nr:hypothetical protein H920_05661 [Fukomys damarensis]
MLTRHSTPQDTETALHWSPRPRGRASHLRESPSAPHYAEELVSQPAGLSPGATFRKRRLSTIYALEEGPSEQSEPCSEPSALGDELPVTAALARPQQKAENLQAESWSHNPGLPGVSHTAGRKRRDPKKRAAVMLRVRQWEARLLQDIEAAVHHELTIQVEGAPSTGMVQVMAQETTTSG